MDEYFTERPWNFFPIPILSFLHNSSFSKGCADKIVINLLNDGGLKDGTQIVATQHNGKVDSFIGKCTTVSISCASEDRFGYPRHVRGRAVNYFL